jgi:hypothetical protein
MHDVNPSAKLLEEFEIKTKEDFRTWALCKIASCIEGTSFRLANGEAYIGIGDVSEAIQSLADNVGRIADVLEAHLPQP